MQKKLMEAKQSLRELRYKRKALILELREKRAEKKKIEHLIKNVRGEVRHMQGRDIDWKLGTPDLQAPAIEMPNIEKDNNIAPLA